MTDDSPLGKDGADASSELEKTTASGGAGPPVAATPRQVETIQFETISRRLPKPAVPRAKTFLEWSGIWQMSLLLAFICLLAAGFVLVWARSRPQLEDARALIAAARSTGATEQVTTETLTSVLEQLQKSHSENYRELFQLVVMSALVPLFTLLAGYVFGRGQQAQRPPPPDPGSE